MAHDLGRVRKPERSESWKRMQRVEGGAKGIYGHRKSSDASAPTPSPTERPPNLGRRIAALKIIHL